MSKSFSPKRRIERRVSRINDTITTSESVLTIHTAEDAKTLVRTIVDLTIVRADTGVVAADYDIIMQLRPGNVQITSPSSTQSLDRNTPNTLIWEKMGVHEREDASGSTNMDVVVRDLKGMRKMKEGDTITLEHISSVASAFHLVGTVTQFFKE